MRKEILLSVILIILALGGCSSAEQPVQEQQDAAGTQAEDEMQEEQETGEAEDSGPELPEDTYEISISDTADPITLKYTIDDEDIGVVESVKFDIRNFGDSPIKPIVILYVGGESDSSIKRFEYETLPSGYKMFRTEEVSMAVSGLHEPNSIKATLRDGLQNEKELGSDSKTYLAKPSYD